MGDKELRRTRKKWADSISTVSSPQQPCKSPVSGRSHWTWPKPPADQQQPGRPRARQLNIRKPTLPPEARAHELSRGRSASGSQRRLLSGGLKPQPPTAPYNSQNAARRKAKDVAFKTASPSKLDQNFTRKPGHCPQGADSHTDRNSSAGTLATNRSNIAKTRTPFSQASPFGLCGSRSCPGSSSKAALARSISRQLSGGGARPQAGKSEQSKAQLALFCDPASKQRKLREAVKVLHELQQHQQAEQIQQSILSSPSAEQQQGSMTSDTTAAEQLAQAQHEFAATAAAALRDVLLLDRARQLLQEFKGLQERCAVAESALQHVKCIEVFIGISNKVQHLSSIISRRQQQEQQHIQQEQLQPAALEIETTPSQYLQEQQQPSVLSRQCSTPRASEAVLCVSAGSNAQLWSGKVTTNALFVSTPTSCCGVNSPTWAAEPAAVTSPLQERSSSNIGYWDEFQPLQSAAKPAQQLLQQQQKSLSVQQAAPLQQQRQHGISLQLLNTIHAEMLQWFVGYAEQHMCNIEPVCRADCIKLLKAVSKAQEWVARQLGSPNSRNEGAAAVVEVGSRRGSVDGSNASSRKVLQDAFEVAAEGSEQLCGGDGPQLQLRQIHAIVRKRLTHYGYLRYQLPA